MKRAPAIGTVACLLLLSPVAPADDLSAELQRAMASADREIAMQAIATCVEKGQPFLAQLREWSGSDDPRLRVRARNAIGQITGQWGSQTDLIWGRSFEDAKRQGKPILLLHLFGKLDEEFC